MKLIFVFIFSIFSYRFSFGQVQKVLIKANIPLIGGYHGYHEQMEGIFVSQPKFIRLFSDCDSVFSTETGKIMSTFDSPKDSSKKLLIKAGNLRLYYFNLKKLNVKEGENIKVGQFIGIANEYLPKVYSIVFVIGDKYISAWSYRKHEIYLKKLLP